MTGFLIPVAAALLIVAVITVPLVRADRRRTAGPRGQAPAAFGCRTGYGSADRPSGASRSNSARAARSSRRAASSTSG
ncbi:hypothetical protein ACWC4D_36775 [Streptomyces sp. NPDC001288]|uniref:hypothetical protein n=1 Tax=unclassified Streptomyces TaxID=2593676 RepID=UPI00331F3A1D